jgi:MFS transporter, SP family, arabinose:H+ symporter
MSVTSGQQPSEQGVFADLDTKAPTSFYWYLALLATIGGFLFGYDTADIGSALAFIPYKLTGFSMGYLVGGASLGAAVGALAAGWLTDRFGRKSLLIVDAAIFATGAVLSGLAVNAPMLLAARTLIGLAVGADSAIATAYIAEFAPKKRRGGLAMLQQWMITIGILASYIIALVILKAMPDKVGNLGWRLILGLGAIPAFIAIGLRARMPESPRWLMVKGRYADTKKALQVLGIDVTEEQVKAAAEAHAAEERERDQKGKTLWTPGVRRALIVVCVFFFFQQITGINIPFYYGPLLLGSFFQGAGTTAVDAAVAGVEVTIILGVVNVAATYFGFRWIDKIGRRPLAIFGYLGMAVFMLVAAAAVGFLTGAPKTVTVMVGFSFFITSFAIGVGGTGWLIQGEVFPTAVRGRAAAIGAAIDWLANFIIIEIFPSLKTAIGLAWVMVIFAVLAVLAIGFVARFLPETKGLSVEEVNGVFEKEAA